MQEQQPSNTLIHTDDNFSRQRVTKDNDTFSRQRLLKESTREFCHLRGVGSASQHDAYAVKQLAVRRYKSWNGSHFINQLQTDNPANTSSSELYRPGVSIQSCTRPHCFLPPFSTTCKRTHLRLLTSQSPVFPDVDIFDTKTSLPRCSAPPPERPVAKRSH